MKLLYVRCGICDEWRNVKTSTHCKNCGAYELPIGNIRIYINRHGVTMGRAIPRAMELRINVR